MFDEITASSLVKVDLDGNQLTKSDYSINPAGFTIHSAIHEVREDAGCVLHLHTPDGTAVASCMEGLLPLNQTAQLVTHDLAYHDYEGIALDHDERPRLQKDLGNKNHMLLRNHGTLTVGRSVASAFERMLPSGAGLHHAGAHPHAGSDRLSGRTGRGRQERGNLFAQSRSRGTALDHAGMAARCCASSTGIDPSYKTWAGLARRFWWRDGMVTAVPPFGRRRWCVRCRRSGAGCWH